MGSPRLTWFIFFSFLFQISAADQVLIVGTVYCDTCFHQEFSKTSHFISGASVSVECGDGKLKTSFHREVKTTKHGEFKVRLPPAIGKHIRKIKRCSVRLVKSNEPYCAVASMAASSSSLRLKSKQAGTHIFSAGYFTFKPLKQPELCNQKPNIVTSPKLGSMKDSLSPPNFPLFPPLNQLPPLTNLPPLPQLPQLPALPPLPSLPNLPYLPPLTKLPSMPNLEPMPKPPISNQNQEQPTFFLFPPTIPFLPPPPIFGIPQPPNPLNPPLLPPNPVFPSPPPIFGIPQPPNPLNPPPLLPPNPLLPSPPPIFGIPQLPNPLNPPPLLPPNPLLPSPPALIPPLPFLNPPPPPPIVPFPFPPLIPGFPPGPPHK